MDLILLTIGTLLILLCLGQLGLWTASSLQHLRAEGRQLVLRQRLIEEEIRSAQRKGALRQAEATAWNGFRRFVIDRLVKETPSSTSVYLKPQDGKPLPGFLPGQHLTLRFLIPGESKPIIRCYSLSDAPHPDYYRITVKAVPPPRLRPELPGGKVSHFVNQQLHEGMLIDSKAPAGDFYLDQLDQRPAILLAGGIGITPMLSMIETVLSETADRELLLVYGIQNAREHIFKQRITDLVNRFENLSVVNCYSKPDPEDRPGADYHVKGRVTVELLRKMLPSNNFQFYLCGPGPFMESLYEDLRSWDVSESQIHFEAFGPASIKKKPAAPAAPAATTAALCKVHFAKSDKTVEWDGTVPSLLEAAEAADLNLDSGCRAGSCGSCQLKLISGTVTYPNGPPADLEAGTCLPCIGVPQGDVELEG